MGVSVQENYLICCYPSLCPGRFYWVIKIIIIKKKIDCDPLSMGQMTEHNLLCYYRLAGDIFFGSFYLLQT